MSDLRSKLHEALMNAAKGPKDDIGESMEKLMDMSKSLTLATIHQKSNNSAADALFLGIGGVMGALRALAMVLVPHDPIREKQEAGASDEEISQMLENAITDDVVLFAALLTVTVIADHSENTLKAQFGPPAYKAALQKFEKLTGRSEVQGLVPALVKAAAEHGDIPFEEGLKRSLN